MIASPVRTLVRDAVHDADIAEVVAEAQSREVIEVVVGLPLSMDGSHGPAAERALDYAGRLAAALSAHPGHVQVRMVDERLTTVDAHRALHAAGRRERSFRQVVDQVAATVLLQSALDVERGCGTAPGRVITGRKRKPRAPRRRTGVAPTAARLDARPDAMEGWGS